MPVGVAQGRRTLAPTSPPDRPTILSVEPVFDIRERPASARWRDSGPPPGVVSIAQVTRGHIEDYKPWPAARPGQNKPRLTPATVIHRLGTLRTLFVRIDEWGWDEAPPKVPMFTGDLPVGA
jgi:hypothetical protein